MHGYFTFDTVDPPVVPSGPANHAPAFAAHGDDVHLEDVRNLFGQGRAVIKVVQEVTVELPRVRPGIVHELDLQGINLSVTKTARRRRISHVVRLTTLHNGARVIC